MSESRDTPVTYTREEAEQIRGLVAEVGSALICPVCEGALEVGQPVAGGGTVHPIWEIRCTNCLKSAYTSKIAAQHRP